MFHNKQTVLQTAHSSPNVLRNVLGDVLVRNDLNGLSKESLGQSVGIHALYILRYSVRYTLRFFYLFCFVCLGLSGFFVPAFAQSNTLSNHWDYEKTHLKQISIDGSLYKKFSLARFNQFPEAALSIELVHSLSRYSWDVYQQFSLWTVPQLNSYAVSLGSDQIAWLAPNGEEINFYQNAKAQYQILEVAPAKLTRPWTAVREGNSNRIEIHSDEDWVYIYRDGSLKLLELPSGRRLSFKTKLSQIEAITLVVDGRQKVLLEAEYDSLRRLIDLSVGPINYRFEYIGDSEFLKSLLPFGIVERGTFFSYDNGFISELHLPNGEHQVFNWHKDFNPSEAGSERLAFMNDNQAFLYRDSEYIYSIEQSKKGISLTASNRLDQTESLVFNSIKNRLSRIDRGGQKHEISWKKDSNPAIKNKLGKITAPNGTVLLDLTYDSEGRVIRMQRRGEAEIAFKYDTLERMIESKRGSYPPTHYFFEGTDDKPHKIQDPLGQSAIYLYNDRGQIRQYTSKNGGIYKFEYNEWGQLIHRNYPMGVWLSLTRDTHGRVIELKHSNETEVRREYDDYNQLVKVIHNEDVWEYRYDLQGRLSAVYKNSNLWDSFSYLADEDRLKVVERGEDGVEKVSEYDLKGNLLKQTDPLGNSINYHYDAIGQLLGWEDQESGVIDFEYDKGGNLVLQKNKLDHLVKRKYNPFGLLKEKDTSEQALRIEYDKADRIVFMDYGQGQTVRFKYDAYGRVIEARTGNSITQYEYNALDQVTQKTDVYSNQEKSVIEYGYNESGNKTLMKLTRYNSQGERLEGMRVRNEYDDLDRLIKVFQNKRLILENRYSEKELTLEESLYGNGVRDLFSYNNDGKLVKRITLAPDNSVLSEESYTWNDKNEIIANERQFY